LREIRTQTPAGPLSISQRIGWDPAIRQSNRGRSTPTAATARHLEPRRRSLTVTAAGVLPMDARTSRNAYFSEGADALRWESTESAIDGAAGPIHKVRLVRKVAK